MLAGGEISKLRSGAMNLRQVIPTDMTASAIAHLSLLALLLLFSEVHPFGSVTAEPIPVDIVTPQEIAEKQARPSADRRDASRIPTPTRSLRFLACSTSPPQLRNVPASRRRNNRRRRTRRSSRQHSPRRLPPQPQPVSRNRSRRRRPTSRPSRICRSSIR